MAPSIDLSWLVLLVLLLLVTASMVSLVIRLTSRRPATGASGGCGQCGYSVEGLTSFQCPECGTDLRQAGITPPRSRATRRVGLILIGVAFVLLLMMCSFSMLTLQVQPSVNVQQAKPIPPTTQPAP